MISSMLLSLLLGADANPQTIRLWEGKAPESVGDEDKNTPTITMYKPEKGNGTAVVVCPGGGYGFLAMDHEGKEIAQWLNKHGVTAFVLKYRIAQKGRPGPLGTAAMLDVQQAIRTVRAKAKDFEVDPKRIGVWGFSAGGHLASTAATHFDSGKINSEDPINRASCRPDFAILAYPVITMGEKTHGGSKRNLLGDKPDAKLVEHFSNELQVTKETPPTFLFHTAEDKAVPIENSRLFKAACEKHGVSVELVEMEKGAHGIGLGGNRAKGIPAEHWPDKLAEWLKKQKLIEN
jgi:acetyl esterase/lipase